MDFEAIFREICAGNAEAEKFCLPVFDFIHMLDDLIDRDNPVSAEKAAHSALRLIYVIAENKFFQEHKARLLPVIHTSTVAFIDSERRKGKEDVRDLLANEVLKSQYMDIFFEVAFLVGGFEWQLAMSAKYRSYHFG